MSKFDLIGPKPVPPASTSLPLTAFGAWRRRFETMMGLITMGVLMIPVLHYPGLFFIVIFAELYIIDAIYARIYGARVKMSVPLGERTSERRKSVYDSRYISRTRPQGLLTK
jgi:hypothetical protein